MYLALRAYQHHVFMDWRFVHDERWRAIHDELNGAGVESMQAKWDGKFGWKEAEKAEKKEPVKAGKPRRKAAPKKGIKKKTVVKKQKAEPGAEKTRSKAKKTPDP
jgi:hypothetical protein